MARMIPLYSASSQAEIQRRAREIFERAGGLPGHDLDHWLQAEADYLAQCLTRQACPPVVARWPGPPHSSAAKGGG